MNRALRNSAPIFALLILLLVSLYSISDATSNSATFGKYYTWLVFFNAIGLIVLIGLIIYNVYKLIVQYRLKAVGSRLTSRMIGVFVILTIIPVSIVYYFSLTFLHRSIDSWFDVGVEQALEDSLQLGRSSLDLRKREALKKTRLIADEIPTVPAELLVVYLNDARIQYSANELTLVGASGVILGSSSENSTELPVALASTEYGELAETDHYLKLEQDPDLGLQIRVVVPVSGFSAIEKNKTLQSLFPITDQVNELTQAVQQANEKYSELSVLRGPLKTSFTLALSLVWLLSVLSAILIAFLSARRLVSPINNLVEATQAVAAGDYERQLEVSGDDELDFLTRSFNTMMRKISRARAIADQSQLMEALQKNYLGSVLEHINSGVLTIDENGLIKRGNRAAEMIFGLDPNCFSDQPIGQVVTRYPQLESFFEVIKQQIKQNQEWQEEVTVFTPNGRKILRVRGTELENSYQDTREHVLVIDDLTELIQAQKDSAWSEMARRLAHEIKNPLTPIQLSAERLQRKLAGQMDNERQDMLDRYTHTIVQQVEAMKSMVNTFTDYARAPSQHMEAVNLNSMLKEVMELYRDNHRQVDIEFSLDECIQPIQADAVRLRQLIHNLVKNAIEAVHDEGWLRVCTRCVQEYGNDYVEMSFLDSGHGIDEDIIDNLFDPYVTSKSSGSGLGLAIVKKIVEEHGGRVWAENEAEGGAKITLRLPALVDKNHAE
ncbi:MAG: ATP-binding protein [Gammaproteobacteria bacterium]|nr:ATP-binding protein [Gammaproteobacteria bacterium]